MATIANENEQRITLITNDLAISGTAKTDTFIQQKENSKDKTDNKKQTSDRSISHPFRQLSLVSTTYRRRVF